MPKIREVRVGLVGIERANLVIVWITADDGLVGVGETLLKRHDATVRESVQELTPRLVGQDSRDIERLSETLYRDAFWVGGPLQGAGRSAIDIALWDMKAKRLGVPIYELLGGATREDVGTYCHCPAGGTPETFAKNLVELKDAGHLGAKTTLPRLYGSQPNANGAAYSGGRGSRWMSHREGEYLPTSLIDEVASYFDAARQAVGRDFELMLDCHGRLSSSDAVRLSHALKDFGLLFLEEPIPPENPELLAAVRSSSAIPIASGERVGSLYEAENLLAAGAVDILQCDVVVCGGITGLKKIAAMAEARYVPLAPHNPNGPIATMASAHVLASIPNAYLLETVGSIEDEQRFTELARGFPSKVRDRFPVSRTPGLGVEVDLEIGERFPAARLPLSYR